MQKKETVKFWDQHHEQVGNQEWIVEPTSNSLHRFLIPVLSPTFKVCSDGDESEHVIPEDIALLEIGCGTSQFAKEIYTLIGKRGTFIATDVSEICIQSNQVRDEELILQSNGQFSYQIFDAVSDSNEIPFNGQTFDIILDKGCLDTFLFRSETRIQDKLTETLLNRIHSMLKPNGKYIVITPRPKSKILRDFEGFQTVQRYVINDNLADLDGNKNNNLNPSKDQQVYMFICSRKNNYVAGDGLAFVDEYDKTANDDFESVCKICGIEFDQFYPGLKVMKRLRRWKGHRIHCKPKLID